MIIEGVKFKRARGVTFRAAKTWENIAKEIMGIYTQIVE